ncbi:MAG: hypothetical protein ACXAEU_12665 [Candidatus Hodarchaeales archaeon]
MKLRVKAFLFLLTVLGILFSSVTLLPGSTTNSAVQVTTNGFPVDDREAPVLTDIQIEPQEINRTTVIIIVILNASDDSGVSQIRMEVCSETFCFLLVEMTQRPDGFWNATLDVSTVISSTDVLLLKVTAEDTVGNSDTYLIATYEFDPENNTTRNAGAPVLSFTVFTVITSLLLFKGLVRVCKTRK